MDGAAGGVLDLINRRPREGGDPYCDAEAGPWNYNGLFQQISFCKSAWIPACAGMTANYIPAAIIPSGTSVQTFPLRMNFSVFSSWNWLCTLSQP